MNTIETLYKCTMCKIKKPFCDFFKDRSQRNGYCNRCKSCDYIRFAKLRPGRRSYQEAQKNYRLRNPEKIKATSILNKAIKNGSIIRPNFCSKCGKYCKPHGHHSDYNEPFSVIWVCPQCHRDIHKSMEKLNA